MVNLTDYLICLITPLFVTFVAGRFKLKAFIQTVTKTHPKVTFSLFNSEPFVIFSGGLSYDKAGRRPTLTIMHGKAITVLEMDYPIVEFMALCETPYNNGTSTQRRVETYSLVAAHSA